MFVYTSVCNLNYFYSVSLGNLKFFLFSSKFIIEMLSIFFHQVEMRINYFSGGKYFAGISARAILDDTHIFLLHCGARDGQKERKRQREREKSHLFQCRDIGSYRARFPFSFSSSSSFFILLPGLRFNEISVYTASFARVNSQIYRAKGEGKIHFRANARTRRTASAVRIRS